MNRRGSVGGITAVTMTALLGFSGLAVDTARNWLVETRLKTAIDAAALVAARRFTEPTRDAEARATFWTEFSQGGGTHAYLGATVSTPIITPDPTDSSKIRIDATATIPTTLYSIISGQNTSYADYAVAQRTGTGLELAIVLDQTSSMSETSGGTTKLAAAKSAVQSMLGVLYGSQDIQRNLWVSVVPFARTINIGTGNSGYLNTSNMPAGWSLAAWSGCVEALRNGSDASDAAPFGAQQFKPYFWPSTYKLVGTVGSSRCASGNAYPGSNNNSRYCHGDNDWGYAGNGGGPAQADLNNNYMYKYLHTTNGMSQSQSVGPNILCALNPIQPLTASRSSVQAAVNAVQAPAKSGGTTTAVGLEGAWYTLSPNWQNVWPNPNAGIPNTPTLPLPYNTPHMSKVVVMLTDGDNNWQPAYGSGCGASGTSTSVCSSATGSELLYDAYGRVANYNATFTSARINPIDQTHADPALDSRFTAVCSAMKASGIIVYIIGFEVASANRSLLQSCATSTQDYFESPTAAQLQTVFTQVANQLATLRLAE